MKKYIIEVSEFRSWPKDETLFNIYNEKHGHMIMGNMPLHMIMKYIDIDANPLLSYEEMNILTSGNSLDRNK